MPSQTQMPANVELYANPWKPRMSAPLPPNGNTESGFEVVGHPSVRSGN